MVTPPQAILASCRSPLWVKVAVGSFLAHFPDQEILVVDNNPLPGDRRWEPENEAERAWLAAHPNVRLLANPGPDRTHGAGMDLALQWCRDHGVETMLHIETDCHVRGVEWYRALTAAIDRGAWMAASHRKSWGPLHPCPSIWRVGEVRTSFREQDASADRAHPRFTELVDVDTFWRNSGARGRYADFFWDTGLRAWFQAAVADRAEQVSGKGFAHYWRGSMERRESPHLFLDPRLLRYSRPSLRQWRRRAARLLRVGSGRRTPGS